MSRGQKRRVPANFPRMKYRARKRHAVFVWPSWVILAGSWEVSSNGWIPVSELVERGL